MLVYFVSKHSTEIKQKREFISSHNENPSIALTSGMAIDPNIQTLSLRTRCFFPSFGFAFHLLVSLYSILSATPGLKACPFLNSSKKKKKNSELTLMCADRKMCSSLNNHYTRAMDDTDWPTGLSHVNILCQGEIHVTERGSSLGKLSYCYQMKGE